MKGLIKQTLLLILISLNLVIFSQKISTNVYSSSGGSFKINSLRSTWSVGDFAINTIRSKNFIATQGFCQPLSTYEINFNNENFKNIICFPVPASTLLNFNSKKPSANLFIVYIYNSLGVIVIKKSVVGLLGYGKINISNLINSKYIIKIIDANTNEVLGYSKFIKIN